MKIYIFVVKKSDKRWGFCVLVNVRHNGHIYKLKKSFIYFSDPILGHPVYQFLHKLEFSDFTVNGSGLPWGTCFGNICHYACQICILWHLLPGAMESVVQRRICIMGSLLGYKGEVNGADAVWKRNPSFIDVW